MAKKSARNILDNVESIDDENNVVTTEEDVSLPDRSGVEWTSFVLSHLQDDEMFNKKPRARPLRRLVLKFCGDIVYSNTEFSESELKLSEYQGLFKVTCRHTIRYVDQNGVLHEHSGIADASPYNLEQDYIKFATVTAETRAKGRCYIEALGLDIIASEEMNDKPAIDALVNPSKSVFIEEHQLNAIDKKCKLLNISVKSLFKDFQKKYNFKTIREIRYDQAIEILQELNEYERKVRVVPEHLIGYTENWRTN